MVSRTGPVCNAFCNQPDSLTHHLPAGARNQRRINAVLVLTVITMVLEIVAGRLTGSMALEADGYHMGSHAGALGIASFAYTLARSPVILRRLNFGTGKILSLGGYSSALVLALVAVWMVVESITRILNPLAVDFSEALWVAVIGLVDNLVSAVLLGWKNHSHDHGAHHEHAHHEHAHHEHAHHEHAHHEHAHHDHEDHNHSSALMHVLADALTSFLAIAALLIGKMASAAAWLDPLMGIVGAIVILHWAWGLMKRTAWELLDAHPRGVSLSDLKQRIELDGHIVRDLHVWSQGGGNLVGMLSVRPEGTAVGLDFKKYFREFGERLHLIVETAGSADRAGPP